MEWLKIYYNILSVGFILFMITSAHLAAGRQYSWTANTITDLGAQGYSRSWIMRIGFIGFGVIMILGLLMKIADSEIIYLVDSPLLLYATAVLFAGIFSPEPFTKSGDFSRRSDMLHSAFAMAAVFAICIAILMSGLLAPSMHLRATHAIFLILIILSSGLFGFRRRIDGLVQRLLFIVSFVWLVFFYNV